MFYGLKFTVLASILQMNAQMHVRDWLICNPCLNIDHKQGFDLLPATPFGFHIKHTYLGKYTVMKVFSRRKTHGVEPSQLGKVRILFAEQMKRVKW